MGLLVVNTTGSANSRGQSPSVRGSQDAEPENISSLGGFGQAERLLETADQGYHLADLLFPAIMLYWRCTLTFRSVPPRMVVVQLTRLDVYLSVHVQD